MENVLEVHDLEKYYGKKGNLFKAIVDISFAIKKGEFVGIMGPSGAGKTTLLNIVSTIDKVTCGKVVINKKEVTKLSKKELASFRRNNLGFIFQDFNLLDTLTMKENIALALTIAGSKKNVVDEKVEKAAIRLGIEDILDKFPAQVSGGQAQRTAAARAIVNDPALILADEPTGMLDSRSAQMLLETLADLNQKLATTIMMVTHDPHVASYCQRILFIKDGRIFSKLTRGDDSRKDFFNKILNVVAFLGGDSKNVH